MKNSKRSQYKRKNHNQTYSIEDAIAGFLHDITPSLKQLLKDIAESEKRIADAKERKARAEIKAAQALSDMTELIKSQDLSALNLKHPNKKPMKPMN